MNKIIITFFSIIFFVSCASKSKYNLIVTVEDLDFEGKKQTKEITDIIQQTSDSLAYFDGSAAFLVYKNSFDLNGYQMSLGRPLEFKVLNEQGTDLRTLLPVDAIKFIDAYYEEHYNRAKPLIEKRRKKMLEQLNAK